ncbi:MAG: aldo/keto reductase [Candidatus Omnitrophica bacterium]|nr:aldo/keto reductase [Candidatus Omnitrophota bacterium]
MISKISLGTVQFGQDYGIANTTGKVSKKEVFEILDHANHVGISYLDTAYSYGDSELIIGEYLKENPSEFKIVSKLPSMELFNLGKVEESLEESLRRIGLKRIYGYLVHQFSDILINDDIWNSLVRLKDDGRIEKIGFSLYSPDELECLLKNELDFDIIQIPYSVFDRRFEGYFDMLKEREIEIQVRSVFLQGLAFLSSEHLTGSLQEARPQLEKLQQIAEIRKISVEALCLNFVLLSPHIDKVIIGVDCLAHFENNVVSLNLIGQVRNVYGQLSAIAIQNENTLLPYKWAVN